MVILDGKKLADEILADVQEKIAGLLRKPKLVIFFVPSGNEEQDGPTLNFIQQKKKSGEKLGVEIGIRECKGITKEKLEEAIRDAGGDDAVDGIIVQLPISIPKLAYPEREKILNCIPVGKDVDVLSGNAMGRDFRHMNEIVWPPIVLAIKFFFDSYAIDYKKKRIVIYPRGKLVGSAVDTWLKRPDEDVGVISITKNTQNPEELLRQADILIVSVPDSPQCVTGDMVKEGVVIIDAGNFKVDGKLVGNVDFESVSKKASYITPVPGGIGPLMVAYVYKNLYTLASQKQKENE